MLRLFATPKTTPTFPSRTACVIQARLYARFQSRKSRDLLALQAQIAMICLQLMTIPIAVVSGLLFASIAFAQEESPPPAPAAAESAPAASPAATTPALSASITPAPAISGPPQLTDVLFKNLKARSIGPAVMGGRVSDIAIDPRNPFAFYVALGHGGIFKSNDGGTTFDPIFDKQPDLSIGAIAVAPSDSDVIWVGTGEANDRNSSDWGNGVYRTTDGGEHWSNVGLKDSRCIARIVVDPKNPEVTYVAAMGHLWMDGGERGLYKTTDGGKTWKLVLQPPAPHNARTGCGDVVLDPNNSQIVFAALYARQRTPWSFVSGPEATGIWESRKLISRSILREPRSLRRLLAITFTDASPLFSMACSIPPRSFRAPSRPVAARLPAASIKKRPSSWRTYCKPLCGRH